MRLLSENQLTIIPVVDTDNNYIGMVSMEDVLNYFAKTGTFSEQGSIIVLEMHRRDYTLAEISRIVESEGAAILSSAISSNLDLSLIHI